MHWAAYYGCLDIVKMLIENGASKGLGLIKYSLLFLVGFV